MPKSILVRAALGASLLAMVTGCNSQTAGNEADQSAQPTASDCDRDCILGITDQYLSAIANKDPSAAPLADNIAFVENLKKLKPGEGLWASATGGPTNFAIYVPDQKLQQAGWMGVVEQNGEPVLLALRLKIEGGRITEAEHLVTPPAQGNMEHLRKVRAGLLATIPEAQRLPHDDLMKIGASYYDALDDNDGSKTPFAADCQRVENGMITAGEGAKGPPDADPDAPRAARDCKAQLDSQSFVYIDRIEDRRMVAADPVTGLVMGLSHFRHPMDNLPYTVTNSDGSTTERNKQNMPYAPFDMPAAHVFKIGPDKAVHEIEAVGVNLPYNSPTGWE